jgi:hypothetical protein
VAYYNDARLLRKRSSPLINRPVKKYCREMEKRSQQTDIGALLWEVVTLISRQYQKVMNFGYVHNQKMSIKWSNGLPYARVERFLQKKFAIMIYWISRMLSMHCLNNSMRPVFQRNLQVDLSDSREHDTTTNVL